MAPQAQQHGCTWVQSHRLPLFSPNLSPLLRAHLPHSRHPLRASPLDVERRKPVYKPGGGRVITLDPFCHQGGDDSSLEQTHTDLPSLPARLLPAPLSITYRIVNSLSSFPHNVVTDQETHFIAKDVWPRTHVHGIHESHHVPRHLMKWWHGRLSTSGPDDFQNTSLI